MDAIVLIQLKKPIVNGFQYILAPVLRVIAFLTIAIVILVDVTRKEPHAMTAINYNLGRLESTLTIVTGIRCVDILTELGDQLIFAKLVIDLRRTRHLP